MTKRIFRAILLASAIAIAASLAFIIGFVYRYFTSAMDEQLRSNLETAAVAVSRLGEDYLDALPEGPYRFTWIDRNGNVLHDTQNPADSMPNHLDREEVAEAISLGEGRSQRYSSTMMKQTVYHAVRLADRSVLRISVNRATSWALALGMIQPLLAVLVGALILSGVLAGHLSKKIVNPINSLDLDNPLDNDTYPELSPLLNRINRQRREILGQLETLKRRTVEFEQITNSMRDGLILLDADESIISVNKAAMRLMKADKSCIGKDFLTINREPRMSMAIRSASLNGHDRFVEDSGGMKIQFDISRIESDGKILGSVILVSDVTDREMAEQSRREFTANVSHELKTPLQGIIGSAQLLENNLVKTADVPRFIKRIQDEAQRLVLLIDDIIRLSQLDENRPMTVENVDVCAIAAEVIANLRQSADSNAISLKLECPESLAITAVKRLVYEIIFNLCDNAIKYNVKSGNVAIRLEAADNSCMITVSDTGIGIPAEHQSRVFERFYRVDKSHSKSSGGTGLGLSIVKHAVACLNGSIRLSSRIGKGTEVLVSLPKTIEKT